MKGTSNAVMRIGRERRSAAASIASDSGGACMCSPIARPDTSTAARLST
jgi:hypothetical protein